MNRTCPEEKLRCSVYLATRRVSFVLNILCLENLWCSFWILRVFRWSWTISEERRIELSALREQYEKVWRDNLNAAHNAGLLSVEPAILRPLLTGALAWTINWYNPAGDVSLDDLVDRALTMILKN